MQDVRSHCKAAALFAAAALVAVLSGCAITEMQPGAKGLSTLLKGDSPADAARWSIDRYDADKRYRGTLLLANAPFANEPVYLKVFTDNSKDEDPGVRAAATRGLANHGTPEHIPLILDRLKDSDASVRIEAARALQRLHSPAAVGPLLDAIDPKLEPDTQVRAQAADALGQYPQTKVVDRLIENLEDENLAINRTTLSSLRTLTGQDFGYDRAAWSSWNKSAKNTFAAQSVYMYPVFFRKADWYEHLPFVSLPPNEASSTPTGLTPTAQ